MGFMDKLVGNFRENVGRAKQPIGGLQQAPTGWGSMGSPAAPGISQLGSLIAQGPTGGYNMPRIGTTMPNSISPIGPVSTPVKKPVNLAGNFAKLGAPPLGSVSMQKAPALQPSIMTAGQKASLGRLTSRRRTKAAQRPVTQAGTGWGY